MDTCDTFQQFLKANTYFLSIGQQYYETRKNAVSLRDCQQVHGTFFHAPKSLFFLFKSGLLLETIIVGNMEIWWLGEISRLCKKDLSSMEVVMFCTLKQTQQLHSQTYDHNCCCLELIIYEVKCTIPAHHSKGESTVVNDDLCYLVNGQEVLFYPKFYEILARK